MGPNTFISLIVLPHFSLSLSNIPITWYGPSGLLVALIKASASSLAPISRTPIRSFLLYIGERVLSLISL